MFSEHVCAQRADVSRSSVAKRPPSSILEPNRSVGTKFEREIPATNDYRSDRQWVWKKCELNASEERQKWLFDAANIQCFARTANKEVNKYNYNASFFVIGKYIPMNAVCFVWLYVQTVVSSIVTDEVVFIVGCNSVFSSFNQGE